MRLIIAGSREFNDYKLLFDHATAYLSGCENIQIVSGTARGADALGESFAMANHYALKRMPANWAAFGRSAGYKRNEEMAIYADAALIFWDKQSPGSKHMIDLMVKHGKPHKIIFYEQKG